MSEIASDDEEPPQQQQPQGFSSFAKTVKGTLFKLNPVPSEDVAKVDAYIKSGLMQRDFEYAYEVHATVNFSMRRDFDSFWESPWADDQVRDSARKKRLEEQKKALAISSFIKASSNQDAESAEAYIANVNRMIEWDEKQNATEVIKTVSRMVQMRERSAISAMRQHNAMQDTAQKSGTFFPKARAHLKRLTNDDPSMSSVIAHTLRRNPQTFDAFARLVGQEILMSDNTSGKRTTTVYNSKFQSVIYNDTILTMLHTLERISDAQLPPDTIGLPMMFMKHSMCIRNDVLVVNDDSNSATYVLSIEGSPSSLEQVDTIKILNVFTEDEYVQAMKKRQPPPLSGSNDGEPAAAAAGGGNDPAAKRTRLSNLMPQARR